MHIPQTESSTTAHTSVGVVPLSFCPNNEAASRRRRRVRRRWTSSVGAVASVDPDVNVLSLGDSYVCARRINEDITAVDNSVGCKVFTQRSFHIHLFLFSFCLLLSLLSQALLNDKSLLLIKGNSTLLLLCPLVNGDVAVLKGDILGFGHTWESDTLFTVDTVGSHEFDSGAKPAVCQHYVRCCDNHV